MEPANWYLERVGAPATRVELFAIASDVTIEEELPGSPLDDDEGNRIVWNGRAKKQTFPELPVFAFDGLDGKAELQRLRALWKSGAKLTLGDDLGDTYTVRAVGKLRRTLLDTYDRVNDPHYEVTIELVEV